MGPVWQGRLNEKTGDRILRYCAGRDVKPLPMADAVLIPYDIRNTEAHTIMLFRQEILEQKEIRKILLALEKLKNLFEKGRFQLDPQKEDVHMNVESFLLEECGPSTGMKIHSGRSRNDQAACDIRMFLRDKILYTASGLVQMVSALIDLAPQHRETVMPGFSHARHATISTFAHLLVSYAQTLVRDLERFQFSYKIINRNPLGAAAGFGTSWPLDRELTTELLGFDRVQDNSIDCVGSRWEAEAQLAESFCFMMNHLSVLCQDFIFLSTTEAGMIKLPDSHVTGSSIMPQKRNPDVLEVTRAKAGLAHSTLAALLGIGKANISGYNRDFQYGKYLIMDLVAECEDSPRILAEMLPQLTVNKEVMADFAQKDFLNAVDYADHLSMKNGIPFRQAYKIVARAVKLSEDEEKITHNSINQALQEAGIGKSLDAADCDALNDPGGIVALKKHTGGPAPEAVDRTISGIKERIDEHAGWIKQHGERLQEAIRVVDKTRREILHNLKKTSQ